jgi:hypothetical protein
MKILQFFQGVDGENSSKRLAGIATTFVMLGLAIFGGVHFIRQDNNRDFLDLVETLSMFAAGMLVSGLAETLMKKKYGTNLPNPPSS